MTFLHLLVAFLLIISGIFASFLLYRLSHSSRVHLSIHPRARAHDDVDDNDAVAAAADDVTMIAWLRLLQNAEGI